MGYATERSDHDAEISIDLGGLFIETEAKFEIDADWTYGDLDGADATLTKWFCDDKWHDRDALRRIVGEDRVKAEERRVCDKWCETAESDRSDAAADNACVRADYLRDLAQDAA